MATSRFSAPGAWANAFSAADFNGLANGSGVLSTATAVDNSVNRHFYADLAFRMVGQTMTPTAGGHFALYLLPVLDDGVTYPDGETTATAANQPSITYFVGSSALRTKAAQPQNGDWRMVLLPPSLFKWYFVNRAGAALPASATAMTCKFITYTEEAA